MKVALRETQQSESTTKEFSYDAPRRAMTRALRIVGSRSIEKSSMRTKTMLGRLAVGVAARTAGAAVALVTDPRRTVSPAARLVVGTPHAAASSAVTLIATVAIGARRISRTPVSPRF